MSFADELAASPALFPMTIDHWVDAVQFVELSREDYASASFLDKRVLRPAMTTNWRSWVAVRQAAQAANAPGSPKPLAPRCHFIFHISHVGSTLLARLLGLHPDFFSVREPNILRDLAEAHLVLDQPSKGSGPAWKGADFDTRLSVYLGLWSRTWEPRQTSVIKATSFVSEMASLLLERTPDSRAIFMCIPPEPFLCSMLGGLMGEIAGAAPKRLFRLERRLGARPWRLAELSPGECVAMSWLSEMASLAEPARRFPERALWINFEQFLESAGPFLHASLRHLGAADPAGIVDGMLASPVLTHYAKKPDFPYDAKFRAQLLDKARAENAAEVRRGLAWLDRAANEHPLVREVVSLAALQAS